MASGLAVISLLPGPGQGLTRDGPIPNHPRNLAPLLGEMSRFQAMPGTLLHVQMGNPCLGPHLPPPRTESSAVAQQPGNQHTIVAETSPKADQVTKMF